MTITPTTSDSTGVGGVLASEDMKKLLPWLLAGGAGAIAGGAMTKRRRRGRPDEEGRLSYLARVLGNAALVGGLTVGGGRLIQTGVQKLQGAPRDAAAPEVKGPLSTLAQNTASNPIVAGLTGGAGLYGFNRTFGKEHFARIAGAKDYMNSALARGGHEINLGTVATMTQDGWDDLRRSMASNAVDLNLFDEADKLVGARKNFGKDVKPLTRWLHDGAGKAFGATRGARATRAGVFGAAALAPSLLYHLLTQNNQE